MLSIHDHDRSSAQMLYVYPVVSRRAGGLSIGINLNVNNACNWACVYCQVPGLVRGAPPAVDISRLKNELEQLLQEIILGDFMQRNVPVESRSFQDIAFSGNGEPTSSSEFFEAVQCVLEVMSRFDIRKKVKLRLISNGSFMHRPATGQGIELIGQAKGEVWFKIDRATREGVALVNQVRMEPQRIKDSLMQCGALAPTWVQTCCFTYDGQIWDEKEVTAYLDLLSSARDRIKGVHLYGLARPSMQTKAEKLTAFSEENYALLAQRIVALGLQISILV